MIGGLKLFDLGVLWKQKFVELIIFLYVFFLVSRCTTAGFSISAGLTILILLYNHKYWYSIIVEFKPSRVQGFFRNTLANFKGEAKEIIERNISRL